MDYNKGPKNQNLEMVKVDIIHVDRKCSSLGDSTKASLYDL